ncbi:MAG: hypothetical protein MUF48_13065 [Pirellulaceae bacterium]|jgi:hypothetical protein|nr:hypothetical protein [Pirellulaceae bacterium]
MRIFLAGIMQGSHVGEVLHHQGYRAQLRQLVADSFPEADVYDPLADHQDSLGYDDVRGREVFERHNRMCREVDVVIAYVPEASMGTAIEMWEAYRHGTFVVAISPLAHNWVIRFCSHVIVPDLESFASALASGYVHQRLRSTERRKDVEGDRAP